MKIVELERCVNDQINEEDEDGDVYNFFRCDMMK